MRTWTMRLAGLAGVFLLLAPAAHAAADPLGLDDEDYWGNVERTRAAVVADLRGRKFQGLLMGAPSRIPIGSRQTLPVAGYFVRSLRDDRVLNQEQQMLVVAVDQRTGRAFSGLALASGKQPVRQKAPPGDPGEGTTLNVFKLDLRQVLGLPWEPAAYRVTMVLGRFLSSSVVVELVGEGDQGAPPAKGPAIELARKGKRGCQVTGRLTPPPTAATKVLLLATGAQTAGPWNVTVDVPPAGKAKKKQNAGTFSVDLLRVADFPKGTQDTFVYAFGSGGAAGPVVCPAGGR